MGIRQRLTDQQVSDKFLVPIDSPAFRVARRLADMRTDRTIGDIPYLQCPACGREFRVDDYSGISDGDSLECPLCNREVYVESVETVLTVTLTTEPDA